MSNFEELLYSKGEEERLKQEADNLRLKLEEGKNLINNIKNMEIILYYILCNIFGGLICMYAQFTKGIFLMFLLYSAIIFAIFTIKYGI